MVDHPEFPQESPAMKYVIDRVSKIEDASNCATGYYRSLAKLMARIDKTDVELNRLHQVTTELKKITDSNVVATVIGKKSDEIQETIRSGITQTSTVLSNTLSNRMNSITSEQTALVKSISETSNKVSVTINRLDTHISNVNRRMFPPLWKLWLYMVFSLIIGIGIGYIIWGLSRDVLI